MPDYLPDLAIRLICPDCRVSPPDIREEYSSGDLVCGECGIVLGDRIMDTGPEWRNFSGDGGDDHSRVGAAADPFMEGVQPFVTKVALKDGGSGMARQLQRTIAKVSAAETHLSPTSCDIDSLGARMSLDAATIEEAKAIRKHADRVLRNESVDTRAACCIMKACRKGSAIRTFKEMGNYSGVSRKVLGRCVKRVDAYFKTNPPEAAIAPDPPVAPVGQAQPELLLPRFINHLELPFHSVQYAEMVIAKYREHVIDSRAPLTIAAAAVYFVSHLLGKGRTTREVAEVSGVKEKTIDGAYRVMYARKELLAPEEDVKMGRAVLSRLPHRN